MNALLPLIDASVGRDQVGGKAANLARLRSLGFAVPEARAIAVDAFVRHVAACRADGATGPARLRAAIVARPLPDDLMAELDSFVQAVGGRVSVRSSANLEDAHTHAFAGQFLTVLNVGRDGVADAVRRVWASAFTDHVHAYLERAKLDESALRMAVVIQHQIDSDASGVVLGDAKRAMVEAVLGQGEAVVSAEVPSDHWDLEHGKIVTTRIARKAWRLGFPAGPPSGSLHRVPLPETLQTEPALKPAQVLEVAELARRLAATFGDRPQDGEFAFVGDQLFVLQARDITSSLPVAAPPLGPWTAPGKGAWELDADHFVRPVTRLFADIFPAAMERGFRRTTARYGALISHLDIAIVNRFSYSRLRPVAAPPDATTKNPPPAFLFKILLRVVPELRRRAAAAKRIWTDREWRRQAAEWEEAKRASITAHLALQAVDLPALSDDALAGHLRAVAAHAARMVEQHHTYNLAAMVPTGDLLAHVAEWTTGRLQHSEVLSLLTGYSPLSADLRSPDAQRLARSVRASTAARALLRFDDPDPSPTDAEAAAALAALRALGDGAGAATRDFLAHREYRLVEGLDPSAPCLRELPALLWRALRQAARLADATTTDTADRDALHARCRAAIPEPHRSSFDLLLEEARSTFHLRDERSLYSDVWAWGILRTVCLEVGVRLLRRSPARIVDAADATQASIDELVSLLLQGVGPSPDELQRRAAFQRAYTVSDAPPLLGPAPKPPPSADLLPPHLARLTKAVMTLINLVLVKPGGDPKNVDRELVGRAASAGVYEGPAHIIRSPRDVETMPRGAVLVVGASSSAFTMLAPLASAVIAEGGGVLSHVAIVCREYRIPCVVGCAGVAEKIKTGDRVRVDGTHGRVVLLERSGAPPHP